MARKQHFRNDGIVRIARQRQLLYEHVLRPQDMLQTERRFLPIKEIVRLWRPFAGYSDAKRTKSGTTFATCVSLPINECNPSATEYGDAVS